MDGNTLLIMKTVVKQILDNRDKNFDANKFIKWLDENRQNLLHLEKQNIIDTAIEFGMHGKETMQERGEEYYNLVFKS